MPPSPTPRRSTRSASTTARPSTGPAGRPSSTAPRTTTPTTPPSSPGGNRPPVCSPPPRSSRRRPPSPSTTTATNPTTATRRGTTMATARSSRCASPARRSSPRRTSATAPRPSWPNSASCWRPCGSRPIDDPAAARCRRGSGAIATTCAGPFGGRCATRASRCDGPTPPTPAGRVGW